MIHTKFNVSNKKNGFVDDIQNDYGASDYDMIKTIFCPYRRRTNLICHLTAKYMRSCDDRSMSLCTLLLAGTNLNDKF